ncbi:MAG: glycosyltransferase [Anaerolineae bacterium]|nr:glycosyltransferase [Anaerolineae bacterium]
MMRIAMVGPFGFHPKKTMRARAFPLARELAAAGHQVSLFMPPWHTPAEADRSWREEGVAIRYVPLRGGTPGITRTLLRETLAFHPDVVHAFKPKAYSGLVAWWLWHRHRDRLRIVVDSDDWEGWGGWNNNAPYTTVEKYFFAWQERWGLAHHHALTVASRTLQSLAWARGARPGQLHYLPNGPGIVPGIPGVTQRAALGLAERPVLLLYSRLFEFDAARLVAILERVQAALPALAILAVGAGLYEDDAASLRRRLAAAGLDKIIVDAGWVDERELPALLAAADAGLYLMDDTLLNRAKCPVKLVDMLAVGLPVAAEAVGQVPEYVLHRQTGLLRDSGDVDGLAADLVSLLSDTALRERLGEQAAHHIAGSFSWQRLAAIALEAYQ